MAQAWDEALSQDVPHIYRILLGKIIKEFSKNNNLRYELWPNDSMVSFIIGEEPNDIFRRTQIGFCLDVQNGYKLFAVFMSEIEHRDMAARKRYVIKGSLPEAVIQRVYLPKSTSAKKTSDVGKLLKEALILSWRSSYSITSEMLNLELPISEKVPN